MSNFTEARTTTATALGMECYRDRAPEDAALPYSVIARLVPFVPRIGGDARTIVAGEQMQVDVFWQGIVGQTEDDQESALISALDGHHVTGLSRLRVVGAVRLYEPDDDVTHLAVTVSVARSG